MRKAAEAMIKECRDLIVALREANPKQEWRHGNEGA